MNKRELAVKYFACLVLVATVAIEFIQHAFYFTHRFGFTAFPHIAMCAMWASSDVRCRFLEHFSLALSCFGSGGTGLASPGRSASASVPEPCSSRHAAWLHFADFCSSGDCVSNPVFHNNPWHRRLACTCRGSQLFSFLEVFWETIRVILFYRWFSWGRTIVCPRLMLSFFIKFPAGQCLMMYDDRYWYMETQVSYMSLAVTSNLQIKKNKNLSKNRILSILQSNDYAQFPLCYQKEKSGGKLGKAAQELSGLVGTLNLSQRAFLFKWAMNIDNKYPRFINVLCKFPLVEHNLHF